MSRRLFLNACLSFSSFEGWGVSRVPLLQRGGGFFCGQKESLCVSLFSERGLSFSFALLGMLDFLRSGANKNTVNFGTKLYQYFFLRVGVGVVVVFIFYELVSTTLLLLSESSFKKRPITCGVLLSFLRSFLPTKKRQKKRSPRAAFFATITKKLREKWRRHLEVVARRRAPRFFSLRG